MQCRCNWNSKFVRSQGPRINGIPVINNQTLTQTVRLKQDETSLVGRIYGSRDRATLASLPGLGEVPVLAYALQNRNNTNTDTEFLILVTPRRLRIPPRISSSIYAGPSPGTGAGGPSPAAPTPAPQEPPQTQPQPQPQPPQPQPPPQT